MPEVHISSNDSDDELSFRCVVCQQINETTDGVSRRGAYLDLKKSCCSNSRFITFIMICCKLVLFCWRARTARPTLRTGQEIKCVREKIRVYCWRWFKLIALQCLHFLFFLITQTCRRFFIFLQKSLTYKTFLILVTWSEWHRKEQSISACSSTIPVTPPTM